MRFNKLRRTTVNLNRLLITLDSRIVFIFERWANILDTVENSFHVPGYLLANIEQLSGSPLPTF